MTDVYCAVEFTPAKMMGLSAGGIMFGHQKEQTLHQKLENKDQDIDIFGSYDIVFLGTAARIDAAMRQFTRSRLLLASGFEEIELSWYMPVEYRAGKGAIVPEDFAEEMLRGDFSEVVKYFGPGTHLSKDKKKIMAPLAPNQQYSGEYYIGAYVPTPADAAVMKTAILSFFGIAHSTVLATGAMGTIGPTAGGLTKTGLEAVVPLMSGSNKDPELICRISQKYFSNAVRIKHDIEKKGAPPTISSAIDALVERYQTNSMPETAPDDKAPRPRQQVHNPANRANALDRHHTRRRNQANQRRMHPRRNLLSSLFGRK